MTWKNISMSVFLVLVTKAAVGAVFFGLAESLACGTVVALVFRNAPKKTAAVG